MSNIDFEIGDGNPAAVAVRFHVAQHSYLSHMDFHLGSGLAGAHQIGNEAEDLRFYGGRYGILTEKTSPAWQFTLIDSVFEGQREAAIREHEARTDADSRHVPQRAHRHRHRSALFRSAVGQGLPLREYLRRRRRSISNEKSPLTEIGFENAVLQGRADLCALRESGKTIAGQRADLRVKNFNYGLIVPGEGRTAQWACSYDAAPLSALPAALPPAIRALPPTADWVNVHTLGVKGDGSNRRHRGDPEGHRHASRALFPERALHRARHD